MKKAVAGYWQEMKRAFLFCSMTLACFLSARPADLDFLNGNRPVLDAHNCYPYEDRWADRMERALKTGFPVAIEQDLAWYVDPQSGKGRVVVSHNARATAADLTLREYFFERVRPI